MIFKLYVRQREQFVCHEAGDIFLDIMCYVWVASISKSKLLLTNGSLF